MVICGRKLLADKYFPLVNQEQPNTEAMAADVIVSQKRIGNLPAVRVPFFPANAIMVTTLENLSIYIMDESHRRHIEENAKRDRVENYESMKIDYVIEDYAAGCLIENIELLPASTEKSGVRVSKRPAAIGADISALADAIVLAVKGAAAQPAPAGEETPKLKAKRNHDESRTASHDAGLGREAAQRVDDPLRHATAYEQMLVKLAADRTKLKQIHSVEKRLNTNAPCCRPTRRGWPGYWPRAGRAGRHPDDRHAVEARRR